MLTILKNPMALLRVSKTDNKKDNKMKDGMNPYLTGLLG